MKKQTKRQDEKKYLKYKVLLLIFVLALFIRLLGSGNVLYNDEGARTISVRENTLMGNLVGENTAQPPIYSWIATAFTFVFGMSNYSFRMVHIIFGMLTIFVAYLFAKRFYGEKTALWTTAIMAFSYYHIAASIQITLDGSILAFFFMLTIYFCARYFENENNDAGNRGKRAGAKHRFLDKYLILTGISFGCAVLTKISAIILIPIIGIYAIYVRRKLIRPVLECLIISAVGFVVLIPYLAFSLINTKGIEFLILRANDVASYGPANNLLLLIQFFQAAIWMGPFIIFAIVLLYFGKFLAKKQKFEGAEEWFSKESVLLLIFVSIVIIFYVFVIKDNFRPIERYFYVLNAPAAIVAGRFFSKVKFNTKHFATIVIATIIFSLFLFGLNLKHNDTIPFYPKEEFLTKAKNLEWSINIPLIGNEGPIGFYLSLDSIIYTFIIASLLFFAYILFIALGREKTALFALAIFIAVCLSFNILITQEYLISATHPNIGKVTREIVEYADQGTMKKPIFVFRNFALYFYFWPDYGRCPYKYPESKINLPWNDKCTLDFADLDSQEKIELMKKGSSIIYVDFPKTDKESKLWKYLNNDCKKIKSFSDKGQEIGFIFEC